MKIAAITITQNDGFKFNEWIEHYQEYKDELFMHIIVDNNSDKIYFDSVVKNFPDSIIIRRRTNGGATGAYNDGIRKALENKEVDSILLIGNDIRMQKGAVNILYKYLFSNINFGMVSPILLKKDSNIIECYGCDLTRTNFMKTLNAGDNIDNVTDNERIVTLLPGGINIASRKFYETIGFQDENLFLYWDEFDMYTRTKKAGFLMGATKDSISWHQHINPNNSSRRPIYVSILGSRNYIYLMKKHNNGFNFFVLALYHLLALIVNALRYIKIKELREHYKYSLIGFKRGLFNNMKNDFIF